MSSAEGVGVVTRKTEVLLTQRIVGENCLQYYGSCLLHSANLHQPVYARHQDRSRVDLHNKEIERPLPHPVERDRLISRITVAPGVQAQAVPGGFSHTH